MEPPIENAISEREPFIWKEVSIDFEGRILTGSYGKHNGMLTVKWAHGTKTKQAGRLPPRVLARMMLRELAVEEKHRARLPALWRRCDAVIRCHAASVEELHACFVRQR